MILRQLIEHYLELLSLKGGCPGTSESIHVKMQHYWKSHVPAQIIYYFVERNTVNSMLSTLTKFFSVIKVFSMYMSRNT